ncbi:NAD(P)-binding protein [Bacillus sp. HMF5848]|uniref:NAD(P)-binding protein n=1 Tax=Bacillus sp. HMF5848 TaxID=2495421 RepID=UPI000F780EBA|nr:NAD(P)-binding protein [Bacillus sp. HMF5848]RSK26018.1 NAD(P)-binding protein [Bacillus sp. HMF5848]
MDPLYPVMLHLAGKHVVVVGGGVIATRKVMGFLEANASITVVSPQVTERLQFLIEEGTIDWRKKLFTDDDVEDAFMVVAATNNRELNCMIRESCQSTQLFLSIDDPLQSDFVVPSVIRRGKLTLAVSTGGASPKLAAKIRRELENMYDDTYEAYVEFLYECRQVILSKVSDPSVKSKLLAEIIDDRFRLASNRDELFQQLLDESME